MKSSCRGSNPNNGLVWKRLNRRHVVCVGFASALAPFGHAAMSELSPLWGVMRKSHFKATRAGFDPDVWSGRALQEVFVELAFSGLASMYPVSAWSCFAPDHHGYQRACDLISGQASTGHLGHQCSHAPGRPILHLFSSSRRPRRERVCDYIIACPCNVFGDPASNERPCARTLQAMRASLLASAIASTL